MEKVHIPIGFQCTVPTVLAKAGLKKETLPFDWLLNTPEFVYTMITRLTASDVDIDKLVREEFFRCDSRATLTRHDGGDVNVEHFIEEVGGELLYNTVHGVILPHDKLDEEHTQKYIRRFTRLRELIFNHHIELCFVYISQSSSTDGNFTINGNVKIRDTYQYLNRLQEHLEGIRGNFSIVMLDAVQSEDMELLNKSKIKHITIDPKPVWLHIVDQCVQKINNL